MSGSDKKEKFTTREASPTKLSYEMVFANQLLNTDGEQYDPDERILHSDLKKALDDQDDKFDVQLTFEKIKTHEESFIRGLEEGEKLAQEKIEQQLKPLRQAIQEVEGSMDSMLAEIKPYMASLVFDMAEKVVEHPIESVDLRNRVKEEITNILTEIESGMKVRIQVSESDYESIQQLMDSRLDAGKIEVMPNGDFNSGEYTVETNAEVVVKTFKKVLKDFKQMVSITPKEGDEQC